MNILKLFSSVRQDYDSSCDLLSEFVQFLVSLLDLLIQSLIFDLKLFEINQMQTICKLLLLLEDLLLVCESIAEGDVLKAELIDLLVLLELSLLLLCDKGRRDLLVSA